MKNTLLLMLLTISALTFAQNTGTFSGQIIDVKTQYPLEGSSVILEGTNIGVITDANGYFTFENVPTK